MITYSLQGPLLVLDNQLGGDCVRPCSCSTRHSGTLRTKRCGLGSWTPDSRYFASLDFLRHCRGCLCGKILKTNLHELGMGWRELLLATSEN